MQRICFEAAFIKFVVALSLPSPYFIESASCFNIFIDFVILLEREYSWAKHDFVLFYKNPDKFYYLKNSTEVKIWSKTIDPNLILIHSKVHH